MERTLQLDSSTAEQYIEEGCGLIKQRFTEGSARPYANRIITDLVDLLDEVKKLQASFDRGNQPRTRRKTDIVQDIVDLECRLCRTSVIASAI